MNANIQNFLWTANSKENLISDTPGYCVSKTKGYSCSCCENLTFLPVLPTQLQRGWQEWQCQQYMMGRELRICDALTPCPVLLLWVCLGYRYSSAHQGPCSLQIPRDLWELTSFPCPAEELGEIPYLQLRNFVNPTARQKHKHWHCQQQLLPARQPRVPRNVLSEVPDLVVISFAYIQFFPNLKLIFQPWKRWLYSVTDVIQHCQYICVKLVWSALGSTMAAWL